MTVTGALRADAAFVERLAAARDGAGRDDEAEDRRILLEDGERLVAAAVGGLAEGASIDVDGVHHRPGLGISVVYRVRWDGVDERLVASTAAPHADDRTDGVVTLDDGRRRVRLWWRRDDPALPGLRGALDPRTVADWLAQSDHPELEVLSYRPGRRAVVAARTATATVFVKVVRPRRADALLLRHRLVPQAPQVIGVPEPGVVVVHAAPGRSLAEALATGDPSQVPDPLAVVEMLSRLSPQVGSLGRRSSWSDRSDFHARAAAAELPGSAAEIASLERSLRSLIDGAPAGPEVPTHGDLNVANLFVDDGAPVALIDVDSVGPGHLADDLATLLAHLRVLPALAPSVYPEVAALAEAWTLAFAQVVDPVSLDARTAAVLLSLVGGSGHEQATARLGLTRDLERRAREVTR